MRVLRHPAGARRLAQPAGGGRARARSAAASSRGTARSCSPASTSAASATAPPASTSPRLVREAGATPGLERLRLSSIEVNHLDERADRRDARDAGGLAPPARAAPVGRRRACSRRWAAATRARPISAASRAPEGFNLTTDVIVGFPAEDDAAFERTLAVVEAAGITKVHVFPYSPRPGHAHRRRRHGAARGEAGAERAAARALGRGVPAPLAREGRLRGRRARRPAGPRLRGRLHSLARGRSGGRARARHERWT